MIQLTGLQYLSAAAHDRNKVSSSSSVLLPSLFSLSDRSGRTSVRSQCDVTGGGGERGGVYTEEREGGDRHKDRGIVRVTWLPGRFSSPW